MSLDVLEFRTLLQQFKAKMLHGTKHRWRRQRAYTDDGVTPIVDEENGKPLEQTTFNNREILIKDLEEHFSQRAKFHGQMLTGPISLVGMFEGDICKWNVFDGDTDEETYQLVTKLIPVLKQYGIEYILEWTRTDRSRCHIWFTCHSRHVFLKLFVKQLMAEAGLNMADFEVYPAKYEKKTIRLPGLHLKVNQVSEIEWNGVTSTDAVHHLKAFIDAKSLTEDEIRKLTKAEEKTEVKEYIPRAKFQYVPRRLKLPEKGMPSTYRTGANNCQALNRILTESQEKDLIYEKGGKHHDAGFVLWRWALYHDIVTGTNDGTKFLTEFFLKYRGRDYSSHQYDKATQEQKENPRMLIPRCETMETYFDYCKGCPLKGRINNPRQFLSGEQVTGTPTNELELLTVDQIRQQTFKSFRDTVFGQLKTERFLKVALASGMGSGKSTLASGMAVELANDGHNVLIAAKNSELAVAYYKAITANGGKAVILASHEKLFAEDSKVAKVTATDFYCPFAEIIQEGSKLGVSSGQYKKKFCKDCPFKDKCHWYSQYEKALEPEIKIVIIQHAHLSIPDTMLYLEQKKFKVLFVDEGFFENVVQHIRPTDAEFELLSTVDYEWCKNLSKWLRDGGFPSGSVYANQEQLAEVFGLFMRNAVPWRIPEYIRLFRNGAEHKKLLGLDYFCPLPRIQITAFLDATLPKSIIQTITNWQNIVIIGDDKIMKHGHPDTKVIQVLNGSCSKSSLSANEFDRYYKFLEVIGDTVREKHKDQQVLVVTYLDESAKKKREPVAWQSDAKQWLAANYPDIFDQLVFSGMTIGTNAYENIPVQFLLCGLYMSGEQLADERYKLICIENFHRQMNDQKQVYKGRVPAGTFEHGLEKHPVRKIMPVSQSNNRRASIYEFSQFNDYLPEDRYAKQIVQYNAARTQQAVRVRLMRTDQAYTVYIMNNYFFPSLLINEVMLEEDLTRDVIYLEV